MPMMTGACMETLWSRLVFELGFGHEVDRIVGAASLTPDCDELAFVAVVFELVRRRFTLQADEVLRFAHSAIRILYCAAWASPRGGSVAPMDGAMKRASLVAFSMMDA